jgi:hypothetical protein
MLQTKTFTAGMDSDTSDELMSPGFDRYRLNTRILSNQDGNIGNAVTTNGNTLTPFSLPVGDNKVIGSVEDPLRKKVYYFVWNSTNKHSILEYDSVLNSIAIVFQDGYFVLNDDNILNFNEDHLITGINVIKLTDEAHLLYWTDAYNEPRKINIEKGIKYMANLPGGYPLTGAPPYIPFDTRILYRIKQPPLNCPDYIWEGGIVAPTLQFNATWSGISFTESLPYSAVTVPFDTDPFSPGDGFDIYPGTSAWTVPIDGYYYIEAKILQSSGTGGNEPTIIKIISSLNGVLNSASGMLLTSPTINVSVSSIFLTAGDVIHITLENNSVYLPPPFTGNFAWVGNFFTATLIGVPPQPIVNHLFKKLFQFKTQFVYDDYEVSAWSPISKFVFPETSTTGNILKFDDFILQQNTIKITIPTGSCIVKKIRIAGKEVNSSDFSLIAEIDKEEYLLSDNSTYTYTFTNEGNYVPLEVNESIKLFDNVPKLSKSQDLIFGNRLVDGLITEGYDNVNIDLKLVLIYPNVITSTNNHYPNASYLKSGGIYQFGIVYYDMPGNRSGVANVVNQNANDIQPIGVYGTKLYVPFLNDAAYIGSTSTGLMEIVPEVVNYIYNTPPSWATHYQVVRSKNLAMTKYIQFTAKSVTKTTDGISIVINNIYTDYKTQYPNSKLVYDFTPGDRIRFIANRATSDTIQTPFTYNDSEITSFDSATGILTILNSYNIPLSLATGALFEIYTPSLQIINDNELVYETCEEGQIVTDIHNHFVHTGNISNQLIVDTLSSTNPSPTTIVAQVFMGHGLVFGDYVKVVGTTYNVYGQISVANATDVTIDFTGYTLTGFNTLPSTITKASINTLSSGDSFRRIQDMTYGANTLRMYVEAMDASNMFASQAWDYGRPNRIDKNNREITRPSTVIYSEQLVPETFINGLSSVFDTNFETYENKYGGIQKMYAKDQRLILFQELKVGAIPISQNVFAGTQGGSVVGTSTQILSPTAQYYSGEFGIGKNPESFAVYANSIYFLDMLRCTPIRLGQDGLISLAETGKMNDYFIKKCSSALVLPFQLKVYGVFDVEFGEYIVSFEDVPTVYQGETVAFDEGNNIFSSFYSYLPENMCSNSGGIVTFKDGNLWTHNSNNTQNNFYGNQYTSDIWMVLNENPMNVKIFTAIEEDSKDVWEVPSISNDEGQESNLISADFTIKENQQYAAIWKDANTPNVPLGTGLFQGDPMRSRAFRIKLKYSGTDKSKLFSVNLRYIISNLHAR